MGHDIIYLFILQVFVLLTMYVHVSCCAWFVWWWTLNSDGYRFTLCLWLYERHLDTSGAGLWWTSWTPVRMSSVTSHEDWSCIYPPAWIWDRWKPASMVSIRTYFWQLSIGGLSHRFPDTDRLWPDDQSQFVGSIHWVSGDKFVWSREPRRVGLYCFS